MPPCEVTLMRIGDTHERAGERQRCKLIDYFPVPPFQESQFSTMVSRIGFALTS